jgi:1,4-alpha-glucan branching enzyme
MARTVLTPAADVAAIIAARHADPFGVLGMHEVGRGLIVRAFVPDTERITVIPDTGADPTDLACIDPAGFFEGRVTLSKKRFTYQLKCANAGGEWMLRDAYAFSPILGDLDDHLLVEGTHRALYERLGAHLMTHEGIAGVHFAVWAPNAVRVSVVGDFNRWDGRRHQMRKRLTSGLWEIFVPDVGEGTAYKFEIVGRDGTLQPLKADPFGFGAEMRPSTASVVTRIDDFKWSDEAHRAHWAKVDPRRAPISIYEVHLGSWMREGGMRGDGPDGGRFLTWDELSDKLIPYCLDMGFTHLELLPVSEHPLDASWGYQPIGLFAPSRRFGDPEGFARFVDRAHRAGLGVILDWVPAHFPTDIHGLAHFDGEALYEHPDPRKGFHPDWNTAIFDFGRREVANILAANALFWLDRYHVDALRVDAVASMLYLDYSRKDGEWLPNWDGSNDNRDAVAFLQRVNQLTYGLFPGTITIAEESTAWAGVSRPVDTGGLGFGFKWNMGWMHDTLSYMSRDPVHRQHHHNEMTFGLLYAYTENFVLPISHDEVVHGKGSLLTKMPGDGWQKFANLRAYYGFMWGHPGKKLLFMGQEFAQGAEWNFNQSLDWHQLDVPPHQGVRALVRDLNRIYRETPALYVRDCEPEGFAWIIGDDSVNSVFAWVRKGAEGDAPVVVISNMTPVPREGYRVGLPAAGTWDEILNTDAGVYGGSGVGNGGSVQAAADGAHGQPASASVTLPPLATIYLRLK